MRYGRLVWDYPPDTIPECPWQLSSVPCGFWLRGQLFVAAADVVPAVKVDFQSVGLNMVNDEAFALV